MQYNACTLPNNACSENGTCSCNRTDLPRRPTPSICYIEAERRKKTVGNFDFFSGKTWKNVGKYGETVEKFCECNIARGIDGGEGRMELTCEWCEAPPKTMRSEEKRRETGEERKIVFLCPLRFSFSLLFFYTPTFLSTLRFLLDSLRNSHGGIYCPATY